MKNSKLFRAVALGAGVVVGGFVVPQPAHANTAVRHAEITRIETIAGYQVLYEGAAVQVTPTASGAVTGECAFLLTPVTTAVATTMATCWFEYVDTGADFAHFNSEYEGTTGAAAFDGRDLLTTTDRQLRFCIRLDLQMVVGGTVHPGPTRCVLL